MSDAQEAKIATEPLTNEPTGDTDEDPDCCSAPGDGDTGPPTG